MVYLVLVLRDADDGLFLGQELEPLYGHPAVDPEGGHLAVQLAGIPLGVVDGHDVPVGENGIHGLAPDVDAGVVLRVVGHPVPRGVDQDPAFLVVVVDLGRGPGRHGTLEQPDRDVLLILEGRGEPLEAGHGLDFQGRRNRRFFRRSLTGKEPVDIDIFAQRKFNQFL